MDKFTKEEKELMQMDVMDSFSWADNNDMFKYITAYRYEIFNYDDPDLDEEWQSRFIIFWQSYMTGSIKQPFTKKDYLGNKRIINSVKAFGLDVEKFWILILYVYYYVTNHLVKGVTIEDNSKELFAHKLMKQIEAYENKDIEITIKCENKKIKISEIGKEAILLMLKEGYEKLYKNALGYSIKMSNDKAQLSVSYQMKMAVQKFEYVFRYLDETLNLIHTDTSAKGSLNKMLLFSRIIFFYGWTPNKNFLKDESSLRGVLKAYKNKPIPRTFSWEDMSGE